MEQVLLKGSRDGALSGCAQAGEPDGEALLAGVRVALVAGEARVPRDVPAARMLAEGRGKEEAAKGYWRRTLPLCMRM